jgi:hypothetical protein
MKKSEATKASNLKHRQSGRKGSGVRPSSADGWDRAVGRSVAGLTLRCLRDFGGPPPE